MKTNKSTILSFIGICIMLFVFGAFLGYLYNIFFIDIPIKKQQIPKIAKIEATTETKDVFINENVKESVEENRKTPTILTNEDNEVKIQKASLLSNDDKIKKLILNVIKSNTNISELSIVKKSKNKFEIYTKVPDFETIIKYIPSLKKYSFFIKPFIGKDVTAYIKTEKTSTDGIYEVSIEKVKVDKFTFKKNMIKSFIDFTEFHIDLNNFS